MARTDVIFHSEGTLPGGVRTKPLRRGRVVDTRSQLQFWNSSLVNLRGKGKRSAASFNGSEAPQCLRLAMHLEAYRILEVDSSDDLASTLGRSPFYERGVQYPLERVIAAVHTLPALHAGKSLADFEVYLGRTCARPAALRSRWLAQFSDRNHLFAAVLFRAPGHRVRGLERAGIRILQGLRDRQCLCVGSANVCSSGGGGLSDDECAVYMTWSKNSDVSGAQRPRASDLRQIAEEVAVRVSLPKGSVERALMAAKAPSTFKLSARFRET